MTPIGPVVPPSVPSPAPSPAVPPAAADGFATSAPAQGGAYGPGLVPTAAAVEARAVAAFQKVLGDDTPFEQMEALWDSVLADTREWLSRPESFGKDMQGYVFSADAPGADVRLVHLQAPRPQLAGTMDRVWSFVQWKDAEGKVCLQPLQEDGCTSYREARVVQVGDRPVLLAVGRGKASTRDGALEITVRELRDGRWEPREGAFVSNTDTLEEHQLFMTPAGEFAVENDLAADAPLSAAFDGASADVVLEGRERHVLRWTGDHYELRVRTRDEILAEERERQAREWREALAPHPDGIRQEPEAVRIGGVKLPVRPLA